MTTPNPWADFLESDTPGRRASYFSRSDRFGGSNRSQRQENYYQTAFEDLYDKYLGTLGLQVRQGQTPTEQWNPYLSGFDWDKNYRDTVPYATRQAGMSSLAPQVRWDVLGR